MEDLSLADALQRLLSLVIEKIRSASIIADGVALALIETVISTAIDILQSDRE